MELLVAVTVALGSRHLFTTCICCGLAQKREYPISIRTCHNIIRLSTDNARRADRDTACSVLLCSVTTHVDHASTLQAPSTGTEFRTVRLSILRE